MKVQGDKPPEDRPAVSSLPLDPGALDEERDQNPRASLGRDVDLFGGDHHVGVDRAFVAADRGKLFVGHPLAPGKAEFVGGPHGDVAGGILIKENLFENKPALIDGGVDSHQSHFPQAVGAFVTGRVFPERLGALGRLKFNDPAMFKTECEPFDEFAIDEKGTRRTRGPLGGPPVGGCKDFLGGQVRLELNLAGARVGSSLEPRLGRKADPQIGSRPFEMQGFDF